MLFPVFAYFPAGQVSKHDVPSRYLTPVQSRQLLDVPAEQVRHSEWQLMQVFVAPSAYLFEGQVRGHPPASKYLAPVHVRH